MFFHHFNITAMESKRDRPGGEGFSLPAAGSLPARWVQKTEDPPDLTATEKILLDTKHISRTSPH